MASLTIKVDLPQALDTVLESPDGMVIVIPATSAEVQAFDQTLSNALAFAQSQAKALRTMRKGFVAQGEVSAKLVAALDQLILHSPSGVSFEVKIACIRALDKDFLPQAAPAVAQTAGSGRIRPRSRCFLAQGRRFSAQRTDLSSRFRSV